MRLGVLLVLAAAMAAGDSGGRLELAPVSSTNVWQRSQFASLARSFHALSHPTGLPWDSIFASIPITTLVFP